MHGVFKDRLIGRKIELLQDEFPGLWVLLQPPPYHHYKAVCSYLVKNPASGFVFIRADERAGSAPNVFVQFRTADSAIGCIGLTVIPDRMGDYAKEFFLTHEEINVGGFAKRFGLNPTLLRSYVNGFKKPSAEREKEILGHVRRLGEEYRNVGK